MGRISKAIKLKLQELRIDDIFKEGILKYKGLLSNEDSNQNTNEDSNNEELEKKVSDNSSLDIVNNFEDNKGLEDSKKEVEEKKQQIEDDYEHDSIKNAEQDIKVSNQENMSKESRVEEDNLDCNGVKENIGENGVHNTYKKENGEKINTSKKSNQTLKPIKINETMMQYFEWYYPCDGSLWNKVKENSKELNDVGITALWLPPACKAADGIYDAGYGLYDLYDLGEFDQKGTVRTKYGIKDEYLKAIDEAHKNNMKIYGDIVFNHKGGADESEIVSARPVASHNRNEFIGDKRDIRAHTIFNFPGRANKYSEYKWTANDFDGVDFDDITKE